MKLTMTDLTINALRKGVEGIESEIRSVEKELEESPRQGMTLKIVEEAVVDLQAYADVLRGIVKRYEEWKEM